MDSVELNIETVYFYRTKAALIANFVSPVLSVDKYSSVVLNASTSYDPDNLYSNYIYKWTCPSTVSCAAFNTSVITVTSTARQTGKSNKNGTTYSYSVQMTDGNGRTSSSVTANVTITMLSSYDFCLGTSYNTSIMNSYYPDSNQTLYLEYN
jgi:hypothetical protein